MSGNAKPRRYENVSVMFTDFVNFTKLSEQLSADKLVELINFYYSAFDEIIVRNKVEKIKTIGDSYMCASGLPEINHDHAGNIINTALDIREFILNAREESTAARIQQNGKAGKINISGTTFGLVKDKFKCTYRDRIEAKNNGLIEMYFVDGKM